MGGLERLLAGVARLAGASLVFLLAGCHQQPIAAVPAADASTSIARPVPPVVASRKVSGPDAAADNTPDLIEVVGTPPQLAKLPAVGGFSISDHGQMPLADGRWRIRGYAAVRDTPVVLARIRGLGLKATVPMSVAERKLRMQPAPP